jgi:hypothetical protein
MPRWVPLFACMGFALVMVLPTLLKGNASGHDFEFHLASWVETARLWQEGVFYPRWAPGAHFGFGEPRFIFYPPVSWILGAALGTVLPWPAVPGAFAWLALTLQGLAAYRLVREWQPPGVALWAAGLWVTNPYNVINVYHRSAFAELLASGLFPLALLYALRLAAPIEKDAADKHSPHKNIALLSLVVAGIWLTNAPAAVITCYSVGLLVVVTAIRSRSFGPVVRGALAGALALALAGFYVVPALYEQKWVQIAEAFTSGLRPEDNFPFTWWIGDEHRAFNFLISWVQMAELALAAALFLAAMRRVAGSNPVSEEEATPAAGPALRDAQIPILCLGIAAALLLLRPTLPLWHALPFLKAVQFPWRFLFVLNLAVVFAAATTGRPGRSRYAWSMATLAVWLVINSYLLTRPVWEGTDVAEFAASINSGAGYESIDEYLPNGADPDQLVPSAPQVALADPESPPDSFHFTVEKWQAEEKLLSVQASEPVRLQLRLLNYPAWQVEVNGGPGIEESQPDSGQLIITVPAGRSRVRAYFARTPDRTAGGAVSLSAIALVGGLLFTGRSRRQP